jgi:hypothetical protein
MWVALLGMHHDTPCCSSTSITEPAASKPEPVTGQRWPSGRQRPDSQILILCNDCGDIGYIRVTVSRRV